MILRIGSRLGCTRSTVELMVVRAPMEPVDLRCDDEPLVPGPGRRAASAVVSSAGSSVESGRRYSADHLGLEVLCTRGGPGVLSVDGVPLDERGSGGAGVREPRRPVPGGGGGARAAGTD